MRGAPSWLARELRSWPREHQRVRVGLLAIGIACVSVGWLLLWLPTVPSVLGRKNQVTGLLGGALGLVILVVFCGIPLVFYVRFIRSLTGSVLVGIALDAVIAWAFAFLLTSDSSTAALVLFYPLFFSYGILGAGMVIDVLARRLERSRT